MHPAEFCECYIMASFLLIFVSNSTLAVLLGIPYIKQRRERVLDPGRPLFGQGEVAQIITSSAVVAIVLCLLLCEARIIQYHRSGMSKVIASITLAALSMVGACCLTTFGAGNKYCGSGASHNPKGCYRRPDVDLPLTWFSTVIALTSIIASLVLHLYDGAAPVWPRKDDDRSQRIRRDSLDLVRIRRSSNKNGPDECQEGAPTSYPPPPYISSPTPSSSDVLPSIPMRKRAMNKLGLTVITNSSSHPPFEVPAKRWRGRGRDVWERKPLGAPVKPGCE